MATIPLMGVPVQVPKFDMGDTMVNIARIKALQQQSRLDEMKLGEDQRKSKADMLWKSVMGEVYNTEDEGGLAAPAAPAAPTMPTGGLAAAQAAPAPQAPAQMAMPPSLGAAAPSVGNPLPELSAPPPAPAPSLATAQAPTAPAPAAAPPAGGLAHGAGTRPMFQGLTQPINERALLRAYQIDPERTEKWYTGVMKMQGDKLKQAKEMNAQIYDVLKAVERSPNPAAAWPTAIASLKERGIPVPPDLERFNPAMLQFKLNEHRTADVELTEAKTQLERQQARTSDLLGIKYGAETRAIEGKEGREEKEHPVTLRGKEADIAYKEAQTRGEQQTQRFKATAEAHDAKMRPLKQEELTIKNEIERVNADFAKPKAQRDADIAELDKRIKTNQARQAELGVPQYLKDDADTNTALNQVKKQAGTESQPPTGKELEDARNLVIEGKIKAAAAHGKDAAGQAATKDVLTGAAAKGRSGEGVHNVLDEMDTLVKSGILSNKWSEAARVYAQKWGVNPDDPAAARTQIMQMLGDRLTFAMAEGKLGGGFTDMDKQLVANVTGNFGSLNNPEVQKRAMKMLRRFADQDIEYGNRNLKQYKETGTLPEFGQVRKEKQARTVNRSTFDAALAKKKGWTAESLQKWYEDNDYIVELD